MTMALAGSLVGIEAFPVRMLYTAQKNTLNAAAMITEPRDVTRDGERNENN